MKAEEIVQMLLRSLSRADLEYHIGKLKRTRRKNFFYSVNGGGVLMDRKAARALAERVLGETP